MVSRQAATGFTGLGSLKADAFREASSYCTRNEKHIRVTNTSESAGPYVLGNFPRAEIQFMCLEQNDNDLTRPKMTKTPDTLIKIENQTKVDIDVKQKEIGTEDKSLYEKLKALKKMKDEGLISAVEHNKLKQKSIKESTDTD